MSRLPLEKTKTPKFGFYLQKFPGEEPNIIYIATNQLIYLYLPVTKTLTLSSYRLDDFLRNWRSSYFSLFPIYDRDLREHVKGIDRPGYNRLGMTLVKNPRKKKKITKKKISKKPKKRKNPDPNAKILSDLGIAKPYKVKSLPPDKQIKVGTLMGRYRGFQLLGVNKNIVNITLPRFVNLDDFFTRGVYIGLGEVGRFTEISPVSRLALVVDAKSKLKNEFGIEV